MSKLISLSQIQGALDLRSDVDVLQASYDAYKVLTDIAKDGGGNYNVNELLTSLKTVVDEQLVGVGEGSVDDRITAAKDDLQAKIDTINATAVKDRVKVTGTISESVSAIVFDQDIASTVPNIDNATEYNVYYDDNTPVLDATGNNLTYSFANGLLSGTPSIADPNDSDLSDGVSYVPVVGNLTNIKVFPVGEFTFEQLPVNYLLDNEEMNLVAYTNAIDSIVVDLSENQELIDQVAALIGTETVQAQITAITDALGARTTVLETKVATLEADETTAGSVDFKVKTAKDDLQAQIDTIAGSGTGSIEDQINSAVTPLDGRLDVLEGDDTVVGSVAKSVKDASDALQAQVDATNTDLGNKYTELYNKDQDRIFDIATINSVKDDTDDFTATVGQTVFALTNVPNMSAVKLIVNGVSYKEGTNFTVDRGAKTATWTFTAASNGFDMVAGMAVTAEYKHTESVAAPSYL